MARNRGPRNRGRDNGRKDSRAPPAMNKVRRPAGLKQRVPMPVRPNFGGRAPIPTQAPPRVPRGGLGQGQWVFVPQGRPLQTVMPQRGMPQRGKASTVSFRQGLKQKALKMTGKAGSNGSALVRIRGFDYGTSEDDVREHCSKVGKVLKVEIKGEKGGHAIVTYSKPAFAEKAVKELNETTIAGNERYINVSRRGPRGDEKKVAVKTEAPASKNRKRRKGEPAPDPNGCIVRVFGFDKGTELDAVVDHCSSAGTIIDSKVVDKGNRSTAFLTYSSKDEASIAVDTLEKSVIPGNERYIQVTLHEPKDDQPRKKEGKGNERKKKEGPSGPDLEREVVGGATMTGKVLRMRGKFGFIKANGEIDHPDAAKHKGDIYFHIKDVEGGEQLKSNTEVEFTLYSDADGLGAQQIRKL